MLIGCGDVESNPGPTIDQCNSLFACAVCTQEVSWSSGALQCDGCDLWQHRDCIGISIQEYHRLGNMSLYWIRGECGLRNINSSVFYSKVSSCTKSHVSENSSESMNDSLGSVTSPGDPLFSSSPVKQHEQNHTVRNDSLTIRNTNCQSIRAKREPFHIMINSLNPNVIIGTESWLKSSDLNSQIFPNQYNIERRDRATDPHGGSIYCGQKQPINGKRIWARIRLRTPVVPYSD